MTAAGAAVTVTDCSVVTEFIYLLSSGRFVSCYGRIFLSVFFFPCACSGFGFIG